MSYRKLSNIKKIIVRKWYMFVKQQWIYVDFDSFRLNWCWARKKLAQVHQDIIFMLNSQLFQLLCVPRLYVILYGFLNVFKVIRPETLPGKTSRACWQPLSPDSSDSTAMCYRDKSMKNNWIKLCLTENV